MKTKMLTLASAAVLLTAFAAPDAAASAESKKSAKELVYSFVITSFG